MTEVILVSFMALTLPVALAETAPNPDRAMYHSNLSLQSNADNQDSLAIGQITMALGTAEAVRANGERLSVKQDMHLYQGDQLTTYQGGHLHIRFIDGALVSLRPGSLLVLSAYQYNPQRPELNKVSFTLKEGVARSVSGNAAQQNYQKFRLNTPVAAIGVRGTDFTVSAQEHRIRTFVSEGAIVVSPFSDGCNSTSLGPCLNSGVELKQEQQQFVELQQSDMQTQLIRFALSHQPNSGLLLNEHLIDQIKQQALATKASNKKSSHSTDKSSPALASAETPTPLSIKKTASSSMTNPNTNQEGDEAPEIATLTPLPASSPESTAEQTVSQPHPLPTKNSSELIVGSIPLDTQEDGTSYSSGLSDSSELSLAAYSPAPALTTNNDHPSEPEASHGQSSSLTGVPDSTAGTVDILIDVASNTSEQGSINTSLENETSLIPSLPDVDSLAEHYTDIKTGDTIKNSSIDSDLPDTSTTPMIWSYISEPNKGSENAALFQEGNSASDPVLLGGFITPRTEIPEGFDIMVNQKEFTLHRGQTEQNRISPGLGIVRFSLDHSYAVLGEGSQQVNLKTLGSRMEINFEHSTFSTGLILNHETTGNISFNASGTIGPNGRFHSGSDSQLIDGATALNGSYAGYYFEADWANKSSDPALPTNEKIQGVTLWKGKK